jgi:hypothetical protein
MTHLRSPLAIALSLALSAALCASNANAQTDSAAEAEAAYARIDFEAARTRAVEALEAGNHTAAQTARLYYLLGMASASLRDGTRAREAFQRMLALDPALPVEQNLAPPLRTPYLEARLFWSNERERFGATARATATGLAVTVTDPLHMARAALVRVRVAPATTFTSTRLTVSPTMEVSVPSMSAAQRVEYTLTLLDEHGNRVWALGSDAAPQVLATGAARDLATPRPTRESAWWRPVGWTALGLGAASLIGGFVAWRVREGHAETWNSDACLRDGRTRDENCADERAAGSSAETWSIVGVAAGGVLAVGGAALLLVAPSSSSTALRCAPGGASPSVQCAVRF